MKIVVTGAEGFLGWHLRCRLRAQGDHEVIPVSRSSFGRLSEFAADAEAIVHLAGINRATDDELVDGNIALAQDVAAAVTVMKRPPRIVYANSIRADDGTPYGSGKSSASRVIADAVERTAGTFVDVVLPNLFGEHGRPSYNSFVATFAHAAAAGVETEVDDRSVPLLHVQDAAQVLIEGLSGTSRTEQPAGEPHGVAEVLALLRGYADIYRSGEIPAISSVFERNLFNTYRAAVFESQTPIRFEQRRDERGTLVETIKVHGGAGQTFFSTTVPGVTRGEHFHLTKIERFVVIGGRARIRVRRLFAHEVTSFDVNGDDPVAVDMPTMWTHDITNTGDDELLTLFWTDSIFDPAHPDTYPEPVEISEEVLR